MNTPTPSIIAQISDCHLFADKNTTHHQANVYQHLKQVLQALKVQEAEQLDAIIFTGDLTQDHSITSYCRFNELIEQAEFDCSVYYLSGNHDERELLAEQLSAASICHQNFFNLGEWHIKLLDSKGETPAGYVSDDELTRLASPSAQGAYELVFMHHHPIDVGYFIDRHGLENKGEFWPAVASNTKIKGIACGHVHNAIALTGQAFGADIPVLTCPATSIQFDKQAPTVKNSGLAPGYRLFRLYDLGDLTSEAVFTEQ